MRITRLHVGKRLSEVAIHKGTIDLAGQLAEDVSQNIEAQTRETLGHIDRFLAEAGIDKEHILSCQIYLADIKDFTGMNAAWDEWVVAGNFPLAPMLKPGWPDQKTWSKSLLLRRRSN